MPCSYHIDTARGVIFVRAWGVLTEPEIVTAGRAIKADPRFNPRYTRLENLLDVTEFQVSTDLVRMVASAQEKEPPPRRAFVAGSDEVFGMLRMVEFYADATERGFLVCRNLVEGMRWVGLPADEPWPKEASPTPTPAAESHQPSPRRRSD